MIEQILSIKEVFSKNRAEELGYDVWKHFVVPPFLKNLDLNSARKPIAIIGGRGCGKTMLLRYISHQSMFSPSRDYIPESDVAHIGLYWRPDTQFCNAMVKRGISEDTWESAFNHYAAIIIGMEVLSSLFSISKSKYEHIQESDINQLSFERLEPFGFDVTLNLSGLYHALQQQSWEFECWVNDVRKKEEPNFIPGKTFVLALIDILKNQLLPLKDALFFVYVDEYENLCDYQQRIINTWLKHSEMPLIFNLAMKRNAFKNRQTLGSESIVEIHDLRIHDIENYMWDNNFPVFAAEILFLHLSLAGIVGVSPINIDELRDPNNLEKRNTAEYKSKVLSEAQKLFPGLEHKEMAAQVFRDPTLTTKLQERIVKALKHRESDLSVELFLREAVPEASIIAPALLYRNKLKPIEIAKEIDLLEKGKDNRFSGKTGWIHNNFIACLLQLYAPYTRSCPFYAGFNTFCFLSRGNLRHFLELCHKSLAKINISNNLKDIAVDHNLQAEAARQASAAFLGEIRSFGKSGNQLHTFVLRLGSLFVLSHQRATQSENEQSHFSITKGMQDLTHEDDDFLNEAVKWSVLFEYIDTKKKDPMQPETIEYILNPIYAPYFYISYRKRKRLELSTDDIVTLVDGNISEYKKLLKRYTRSWSAEPDNLMLPIFSLLDEDSTC
jgi:hypothetical protein